MAHEPKSGIRDEQDRDRLQELVASDGYKLLVERLQAMLERERKALESLDAADAELRYRQGSVFALHTVLDLPQIMMAEFEPEQRGRRG